MILLQETLAIGDNIMDDLIRILRGWNFVCVDASGRSSGLLIMDGLSVIFFPPTVGIFIQAWELFYFLGSCFL